MWNGDGMDEDEMKWTQQRLHKKVPLHETEEEEQSRAERSGAWWNDELGGFQDMLVRRHSLAVQQEGLHIATPSEGVCLTWLVCRLLALSAAHDTWCISRGQESDYSWPFVWSTKQCPGSYARHPPYSSEHISVWGAAERQFRPRACCSSLSLSLCLCFSLRVAYRTQHVGWTHFHINVQCCLNIKRRFM